MNIVKTKRYTQTRIQRILLYALLGITKEDIKQAYNFMKNKYNYNFYKCVSYNKEN